METRSKFVGDRRAQISSRREASVLFLPEDREAFILNLAIHIDQPLVQEATTQTEMLQPQELLAVPPHLRDCVSCNRDHVRTATPSAKRIEERIADQLVESMQGMQIPWVTASFLLIALIASIIVNDCCHLVHTLVPLGWNSSFFGVFLLMERSTDVLHISSLLLGQWSGPSRPALQPQTFLAGLL